MPMVRLQKVLARAGIGARRACEDLILEGRVRVNGRVVRELGSRVDPETDRIEVDGLSIEMPEEHHYIALYKPVNVVSTVRDPQGRRTVRDLVDVEARIYPVGRLDYDSEGLILMTDDGDLAYRLTHPSFEVEKEYRVLLDRSPTIAELRQWRKGVELEDGRTAPAWVEILQVSPEGVWSRVVLHEGRNRMIRRVAGVFGMQVKRLIRVREGPVVLGTLKPGEWRQLSRKEVAALDQNAPKVAPEGRRDPAREELARERGGPGGRPFAGEARGPGAPQRATGPTNTARAEVGGGARSFRQGEAYSVEDGRDAPSARRWRSEEQRDRPAGQRGRHEEQRDRPAGQRGRHEEQRRAKDEQQGRAGRQRWEPRQQRGRPDRRGPSSDRRGEATEQRDRPVGLRGRAGKQRWGSDRKQGWSQQRGRPGGQHSGAGAQRGATRVRGAAARRERGGNAPQGQRKPPRVGPLRPRGARAKPEQFEDQEHGEG